MRRENIMMVMLQQQADQKYRSGILYSDRYYRQNK
jgi:hypothetical protein